ncbi:MAG: glycogen/starch/alpha-glucan phosphorylase, partial [Ramlibacter sp.]|nr:glycogen/starch/alpha-glucan phosphorylase [Ramlibacter sp.]
MNQKILESDIPVNTVDALRRSIMERLVYSVGKDVDSATQRDWMFAVFHAVRDRIVKRWRETLLQARLQNAKRVYYLSMEYLTGRALVNALLATDLYEPVKQACTQLGADFDALVEVEPDPALGNGGLGRLAACFMDSLATIGLPGIGYGLRYEYGMFSQRIVNGRQIEEPDYWLVNGNPWDFMRPELSYTVRFGGRLASDDNDVVHWVDTEEVLATAYDNGVPGYGLNSVATMRLWAARASSAIDLEAFNRGDYLSAVDEKNRSENVTRVLYPEDSSEHGKELR